MFYFAGMNGARSDRALYNKSSLKKSIEGGHFLTGPKFNIGGIPMHEIILADSGFTLNDYTLTPFDLTGVTYALDTK